VGVEVGNGVGEEVEVSDGVGGETEVSVGERTGVGVDPEQPPRKRVNTDA